MKVEVAVTDTTDCKKDLTIEVDADEVRAEFEKNYQAFARHAKVPGFRPGHVPLAVVKQRFSKDIKDGVLEQLLPHALQHVIVDKKLRVIGSPDITDVNLTEGQPFRFKATVEVLPEFDLRDYTGLKLTKPIVRVTDEDVDRVIENWRHSAAQLIPVEDRPAQDGDSVSVNLIGKYVEPGGEEDLKADDVVIQLGSEGVQPEFSEHLRGVKTDDERQFRVAYPPDFSSPGLAGKTLDFTANVVAVRQEELPSLDDDFAKEVGAGGTLQELRENVRGDLERQADAQAERRMRDGAIDELLRDYDFSLPDTLVDRQASELLRELAYVMLNSGVPAQSIREMNWEERRGQARVRAVRDVRAALIIERIAEVEKIEVTDDEIEAEIARIAGARGEAIEAVRARLTKEEGLSSIENRLRHQKTLDVVLKSAEVTVQEVTETQTMPSETPESLSQPEQSPEQS